MFIVCLTTGGSFLITVSFLLLNSVIIVQTHTPGPPFGMWCAHTPVSLSLCADSTEDVNYPFKPCLAQMLYMDKHSSLV